MFMLPEGTMLSAFIGGAISKVINDGVDYTKPTIRSALNDKNNRNYSTKIYRVIEKSLNIITNNKHKDSNDLYDAIEKIFNEFKNHGDTLESVKFGLNVLGTDASDQRCENFLEKFYEGIRQDDDLYKAVMMDLELKDIKFSQEEFQKINEKLDRNHTEIIEKLDGINESGNEGRIDARKLKFQNNKKHDYIKKWNSRLFLHFDNDERPITLADAFIIPNYKKFHFLIGFFEEDTLDEDVSDENVLDEVIEKFVNYEKTSTMLITGVPGMGKTSIVSWLAHKYETDDNLIILRFRDWDSEELYSGLLKAICNTLKCKRKDLNEKFLVLDGFDEMKSLDRREDILSDFLNSIKDLEKSKIIITSRPTYITTFNFDNNIELLPFSAKKIQRFYKKITGIVLNKNEIDKSNLDVIGIPVILYMAIMSNIDITESSTKPELYNRIFAKRGGIFDRFSEYDSGSQLLRNADNIKKYLEFLQKIAFKMFEKDNLLLSTNECDIPKLKFEGKSVSILEFPIKHLFENIEANIEFIHKSVYEYFISEYIFYSISEIIKKDNFKIEELSGVMGVLFKYGKLSFEIIEFLKYRVRNSLNDKYDIVSSAFNLMLEDGMTYYTRECYRNVIDCELCVFKNMLEIVHLWEKRFKLDKAGSAYLKSNKRKGINLSNMDLIDLDLSESYLVNSNLSNSNLSDTTFRNANLEQAKLDGAFLKGTDLRGAILIDVNFSNTILEDIMLEDTKLYKTIFSENQIEYLKNNYSIQKLEVTATEYVRYMNIRKSHHEVSNLQDEDMSNILNQNEIDDVIEKLSATRKHISLYE